LSCLNWGVLFTNFFTIIHAIFAFLKRSILIFRKNEFSFSLKPAIIFFTDYICSIVLSTIRKKIVIKPNASYKFSVAYYNLI
jgi:hypothetical protein